MQFSIRTPLATASLVLVVFVLLLVNNIIRMVGSLLILFIKSDQLIKDDGSQNDKNQAKYDKQVLIIIPSVESIQIV